MMSSQLQITSIPNQGSTFYFDVKLPTIEKEKSKERRNISAVTVSEDKIFKLKKVYEELKRDQD